jgi:hypothetical protein
VIRNACALLLSLLAGACILPSDPGAGAPDLRGDWQLTGEQSSPMLELDGVLSITAQEGELIVGTLSWEESDGLGGTRTDGGPASGRVISGSAVDFDVFPPTGGTRRFVARLSGDTIEGTWLQLVAGGVSGEFMAIRTP